MEILFQDNDFVAVHKPVNLLVHRSQIDRHETAFALQQVRDQIGQYVYPVHRLDKPTSGVLLFALNVEAAHRMTAQFAEGLVSKRYLTLVRGFTAEYDVIDYPLKEQQDRMTDTNVSSDKPAQAAVTDYRRLATFELPVPLGRYSTVRYSLLEVSPKTGRKHQIRRHMKHIFHPILGDTTHGDGRHNQFFKERFACNRLMLAATELKFIHPNSKECLHIRAPLADDFMRVVTELGWLIND